MYIASYQLCNTKSHTHTHTHTRCPETSMFDLVHICHSDCSMKPFIQYSRARDVQRKIVSIVAKWNSVCIMNELTSRYHYRHVVCRETMRIRNNRGRLSPMTRTKPVPLVTRNAIEIVFSTPPS